MQVKYFAYYRDLTKRKQESLPAPATIGNLLESICTSYGQAVRKKLLSDDGTELGPDAIVLINGRNIMHLGMLSAPLVEDDVVSIFPIVAGG